MTRGREEWVATIRGTLEPPTDNRANSWSITAAAGAVYFVDDDEAGQELAESELEEVDVTGMARRGADGTLRLRVVAYDLAAWETANGVEADPGIVVSPSLQSCC